MKLHDKITPVHQTAHNSVLLYIVLPILAVIAFLSISLAILYACLRQMRQRRRENSTGTNQQVVTVCIHTKKIDC